MREVMQEHTSVGFEYEFIGHSIKKLPSHIKLATSDEFSLLFGIPFVLETDSGDVIEFVMPPLLIPNQGNKINIEEIKAVHENMEQALLAAGTTTLGKPLGDLIADLKSRELAAFTEIVNPLTVGMNTMLAPKLNGKVYPQLNLSMNADRSAALITATRKTVFDSKVARNDVENSAIGHCYDDLEKSSLGLSEMRVHVNKALSNTLAIPSILIKRNTPGISEAHDLSSIVKELWSVWVKDSLPNILASSATAVEVEKLKSHMMGVGKRTVLRYHSEVISSLNEYASSDRLAGLQKLTDLKILEVMVKDAYDKPSHEKAGRWLLKHEELAELQTKHAVMFTAMTQSDDFVEDPARGVFTSFLDTKLAAARQAYDDGVAIINTEIDAMAALIGTEIEHKKFDFNEEPFGTGHGVRKDTFIPPFRAMCQIQMNFNVVELRSSTVVDMFFNNELGSWQEPQERQESLEQEEPEEPQKRQGLERPNKASAAVDRLQ